MTPEREAARAIAAAFRHRAKFRGDRVQIDDVVITISQSKRPPGLALTSSTFGDAVLTPPHIDAAIVVLRARLR